MEFRRAPDKLRCVIVSLTQEYLYGSSGLCSVMGSRSPDDTDPTPISSEQAIREQSSQVTEATGTTFYKKRGQIELTETFPQESYLWNPDFHPTPITKRTWGAGTFFAIWLGMVVIIPTWTLSAVGMGLGLNWSTALILMFLGNLIVLIPTLVQSHGGARYGMAEPQLTRTRWGIYGAQVPSWIRAIISMGWWGVESFIIAEAAGYIYLLSSGANLSALGSTLTPGSLPQHFPAVFWTTFALVIAAQLLLFWKSPPIEAQPALKWLARLAAPVMIVGFAVMFYYFLSAGNFNFTPITSYKSTLTGTAYWLAVIAFLNSNVAYWATMAVSMPDYTRYAKSQFSQTFGQIPMPLMMMVVGAMGLLGAGAAASAGWIHINTASLFGYDPVGLIALHFPTLLAYALLVVIIIATFTVNVFANSVAPGYDIANTYAKKLTWFRGILIGVVFSLAVGAYSAYSSGGYAYVFGWLLAYGALLGGVEGVIFFDYALLRRFKFELRDVFLARGKFRYIGGVNPAAIIGFTVGIVVTYLNHWGITAATWSQFLYNNSWVTAFLISGVVYTILMAAWVIPRYQPHLKGNIIKGYTSQEVEAQFSEPLQGELAGAEEQTDQQQRRHS
jgi:NCS1 family nucleobase:cation symporter-1